MHSSRIMQDMHVLVFYACIQVCVCVCVCVCVQLSDANIYDSIIPLCLQQSLQVNIPFPNICMEKDNYELHRTRCR